MVIVNLVHAMPIVKYVADENRRQALRIGGDTPAGDHRRELMVGDGSSEPVLLYRLEGTFEDEK